MSRKKKRASQDSHLSDDVQITSPPEPASPKDAAQINPDEFPFQPSGVAGRDFKFQAIFTPEVLQAIHDHGKTSMEAEICGVLVGDVYRDTQGPFVRVHASIRGDSADSRNAQVTFKAETWTHIQQEMERDYPDSKIVGWYHTHPGFGIFLSGMDLFIQDNFFNLPWQIALVYDPQSEEEGVFIWREGKTERETHLVEASSAPTAAKPEALLLDPAQQDALTPRTWLLAGILFVLSFGLTYVAISLVRATVK